MKSVVYKYSATDPGADDFLNWDDCKKDDLRHFKVNHTTLNEDAGTLCFPGGNSTGTWSLSGNSIVMDGGGRWTIYRHIILPMSKPALGTLGIGIFTGCKTSVKKCFAYSKTFIIMEINAIPDPFYNLIINHW